MSLLLLLVSIVCGLAAASVGFGWFDATANYNGWLALAVVFLAASFIPWKSYFR